ncbi:hypothetical protein [Nocardia sp. bgisy118]|uniref:hypothetical protein n=1 Tax=Nocardia sp. bgisy118 TaxID=3413786 RepID=UPI003F4A1503
MRALLGLPDEVGARVSFAPPMRGGFIAAAPSGRFESGAPSPVRKSPSPARVLDVHTTVVDGQAQAHNTVVSRSVESFDTWADLPIIEIPPGTAGSSEYPDEQGAPRHRPGAVTIAGDVDAEGGVMSSAVQAVGADGTDGEAVSSTVPQKISPTVPHPAASWDRSQHHPAPAAPECVGGIRRFDQIPEVGALVVVHGGPPEPAEVLGHAASEQRRTTPDARPVPSTVVSPACDEAQPFPAVPILRPSGSLTTSPGKTDASPTSDVAVVQAETAPRREEAGVPPTPDLAVVQAETARHREATSISPPPDSVVVQNDSPRVARIAASSATRSEHRPAAARTVSRRPVRAPATAAFGTVDDGDASEWSHPPNRAKEEPATPRPPEERDFVGVQSTSALDGAIAFWERRYLSLLRLRNLR